MFYVYPAFLIDCGLKSLSPSSIHDREVTTTHHLLVIYYSLLPIAIFFYAQANLTPAVASFFPLLHLHRHLLIKYRTDQIISSFPQTLACTESKFFYE